ncbi:MAG: hypothetical protein EA377_00845 [Phycisphaerales bacterium]|nr:MAG: hypothetical protein EA377_00845 [Phycisphaerales bacterium]
MANDRLSQDETRRKFVYGASDWMWVIINGVDRCLLLVHDLDVTGFRIEDADPVSVRMHRRR